MLHRPAHPGDRVGLRRLSYEALPLVPQTVRRPSFNPRLLRPGILHIGCGNFHRAHQAVMTQHAIECELTAAQRAHETPPPPWGIVSTSLRTPATVRALQRQQGLYTVLERGPEATSAEVIATLTRLAFLPDEVNMLLACFADPSIRIVTLTVTASGYSIDPATSRLDVEHGDIQHDLRTASSRTAVGLLVKGLAERRASGAAPPVVLSCDNMAANGRLLRQACIDFASLLDDTLAEWIAAQVQFPSTMVDRIVPATTEADREEAAAALGLADAVPVSAEPFCQWVIERFDGPRPFWEAAGAEFVQNVAPWESAKLRLLNGGHLALAYLGLLAGLHTVAEVAADPAFGAFVLRFMLDEQRPTLPPVGQDLRAYARRLLDRWRNPGIVDQLARVGRDGSTKLPARLLDPLRENLQAGRPAPCTVLAIAAWMRCATGHDGSGRLLPLRDPMAARLRHLGRQVGGDPERLVDAFLGIAEIFGDDLPQHPLLRPALVRAMIALQQGGARGAVADCLSGAMC